MFLPLPLAPCSLCLRLAKKVAPPLHEAVERLHYHVGVHRVVELSVVACLESKEEQHELLRFQVAVLVGEYSCVVVYLLYCHLLPLAAVLVDAHQECCEPLCGQLLAPRYAHMRHARRVGGHALNLLSAEFHEVRWAEPLDELTLVAPKFHGFTRPLHLCAGKPRIRRGVRHGSCRHRRKRVLSV